MSVRDSLKRFEVCFISGHSLRYNKCFVKANSEEDAVRRCFDREGANFENRLISVRKAYL